MLQPPRPTNTMPNKEVALILSDIQSTLEEYGGQILTLNDQYNQISTQTPEPPVSPQAVNQLFNGDFSHSVDSWADTTVGDNRQYECQQWFSHPTVAGQAMFPNTTASGNATLTFTNTDVDTVNDRVTIALHGLYTGTAVLFTSSSPPAPLVTSTVYYIIRVNENRFKLATTYANAIAGTAIDLTTAGGAVTDTIAYNYTLKEDSHTLYSEGFSDWSWTAPSAGCARFQGAYSVDQQLPGNNIQPGYTYYGVFNIVKLNQYIACSSEERIWCGLYAEQDGTWDWIQGDFDIDYEVLDGNDVLSGTSRDYRILVTTDRGFTILSNTLTIANAPSNTNFSNGWRVYLSWKTALKYGVQTYDIYRKTGATYVLLQQITTGLTSTLDNNSTEDTAVGWPSATFNALVAYTATIPDVIDSLPYSGDPLNPLWATIPFTLKVPASYDMSLTDLTKSQWLRWGFSSITGNLDIRLTDGVIVDGDATVTSASGQFTADMVGLTMDIYYAVDVIYTVTITTYNSATSVEVSPAPDETETDRVLYIHEGAPDHSIFFDLAHLSWQLGAAFAPNAADIDGTHGIPPVAPNGTTQGGAGGGQGGGGIDGQPICLMDEESVETKDGVKMAIDLKKWDKLPNGYGGWNTITEITLGISDVWYIETENGCTLRATPTKQIFTSKNRKKTLAKLNKGDKILTMVNGVLQPSPIFVKCKFAEKKVVVRLSLTPNEKFLAGTGTGTILCSNAKPVLIQVV